MDRDLIEEKLLSISRCLDRLSTRRPTSVSELQSNYDTQDIISVNLQRAVQLCVDIGGMILIGRKQGTPGTMADVFVALEKERIITRDLSERLQRAVGFRNVSVHEYQEIDWAIVYDVVTNRLDDFRSFARAIRDVIRNEN